MKALWSTYGNHHTTCCFGFSAEVVETEEGCVWFVYVKMDKLLEEGSARSVTEAKASAEASLRHFIEEREGISRKIV